MPTYYLFSNKISLSFLKLGYFTGFNPGGFKLITVLFKLM